MFGHNDPKPISNYASLIDSAFADATRLGSELATILAETPVDLIFSIHRFQLYLLVMYPAQYQLDESDQRSIRLSVIETAKRISPLTINLLMQLAERFGPNTDAASAAVIRAFVSSATDRTNSAAWVEKCQRVANSVTYVQFRTLFLLGQRRDHARMLNDAIRKHPSSSVPFSTIGSSDSLSKQ